MDLKKIQDLIGFVSHSGIAEIEITESNEKIRIIKFSQSTNNMNLHQKNENNLTPSLSSVDSTSKTSQVRYEGYVVKSPMVGTFYRSSSPGSAPFVNLGQTVNKGDPLCIIEAMKLLNEIESEKTGTITEILIENGDPVEYGQPLFIIE